MIHVTRRLLLSILAFNFFLLQSSWAAVFTVINTNDSGAGSLRQAIADANSNSGADTIEITATGTIALNANLTAITEDTTITGPGAASLTIDGQNSYRIFEITDGIINITGLTLKNGLAHGGNGGLGSGGGGGGLGAGGALFVGSGSVTLTDVFFDGNKAIGGFGGSSGFGAYGGGGGGGRDVNGQSSVLGYGSCDGGDGGGSSAGAGGAEPGGNGGTGDDYSGAGGGACWQSNGGGSGGVGGFGGGGGGGGYEYPHGGNGGFGGGGGGGANGGNAIGGIGGGNGGNCSGCVFGGGGGGGAALGGAVFVRSGAVLNVVFSTGSAAAISEQDSTVTGGYGGAPAYLGTGADGAAAGSFLFLQGPSQTITINVADGLTRTISGKIADETVLSGGSGSAELSKTGDGTLQLTAEQSYSGTTTVSAGLLEVDGTVGVVMATTSGVLGGAGQVGNATIQSGAALAPGNDSDTGILSTGDLTIANGGTLAIKLNGSTAGTGYDQVAVSGDVDISNASITLVPGFTPTAGSSFLILDNDGSDAITGSFSGWSEGTAHTFNGRTFVISYAAGDGNDVVITYITPDIDLSGNSHAIVSGDTTPSTTDGTDFGTILVNTGVNKQFRIQNSGDSQLTLSGSPLVAISGTDAASFSLSAPPAATIAASGSSDFTLRFQPTSAGLKTAVVTISSNDPDEGTYTFSIQGRGDIDTDHDGIIDSEDPDDDGDGVSDTQEALDGSDPLDVGSVSRVLPNEFCAEWNGFLGGLWNILEFVNISNQDKTITTTIKDLSGTPQSSVVSTVLAGAEQDVIVHDMQGWTRDSYGEVCVTVDGQAGDIDGRMVYYKPDSPTATTSSQIQFAYAMPFLDGLRGVQDVLYNTFQPSLDPADAANGVADWIELINLESSEQSGNLVYYAQDGSILKSENVTLAAGARRDFSAHQLGASLVGTIEWQPGDSAARFQFNNARYYYDNPFFADSFTAALELDGVKGSGAALLAPVDTRSGSAIVEIGNTLAQGANVSVKIYDAQGQNVTDQTVEIAAHGTYHIIVDPLLPNALGTVKVQGPQAGSVIAAVLQYERTATGGIQSVSGIPARQALGSVLRGTYNSFLNQSCTLLVGSTVDQTLDISARRSDGTDILTGMSLSVPANGITEVDLCSLDAADHYGVVTVQPASSNSTGAYIVRLGAERSYRLPTQLH
jgi:hypothetical protein